MDTNETNTLKEVVLLNACGYFEETIIFHLYTYCNVYDLCLLKFLMCEN